MCVSLQNPPHKTERFSFLILGRESGKSMEPWPRVTQPVLCRKRHVHVHLCCADGTLQHAVVTSKKHSRYSIPPRGVRSPRSRLRCPETKIKKVALDPGLHSSARECSPWGHHLSLLLAGISIDVSGTVIVEIGFQFWLQI